MTAIEIAALNRFRDASDVLGQRTILRERFGNFPDDSEGAFHSGSRFQRTPMFQTFRGCEQSQAPFIIQLSKGARKYADKRMIEAMKA